MPKRIITVETRLQPNSELVTYLNSAVSIYEKTKRKIYHEMTNSDYSKKYKKEAEFTKHCRDTYELHSRTINSIIHEVKGSLNAFIELKKTELSSIEQKIETQTNKINKIIEILNELKPKVTNNEATAKELYKYRKNKYSLYYQKNRLNKLKIRKQNLEYIIEYKVYNICFGSKQMLRKQHNLSNNGYKTRTKWYNDFVKHRDKNILFLGSANETLGNQMTNLFYNKDTDLFEIKVRKIEKTNSKRGSDSNYVIDNNIKFSYHKEDIISLLKTHSNNANNKQPISYRFHREGTTWYLQIIFKLHFDTTSYVTRKNFGVIGLDYNDGFIQLAETDRFGNLVNLKKYNLQYHGTGNKAKTEIEQTITEIMKYAKLVGKDIAYENLNFKKTKAKQSKATSDKGKHYNKMLHQFDYSRYKQKLQDISFNNQVFIYYVNPKNTSKIGKEKYANRMKLTTHQSAAFVIARRYQGFKDNLKSKENTNTTNQKVA